MSRILLTCIIKDDSEAKLFQRMMASFMPACQGAVCVFTGVSQKFTKLDKIAKQYGAIVIHTSPKTHPAIYHAVKKNTVLHYFFANFAEARNVAFEKAALLGGYDWWTWADVDDVLQANTELQTIADQALAAKIDEVFFTYWYSVALDEKGMVRQVNIEHSRERLLRPNLFRWTSRLHEVVVPKDDAFKPRITNYDFNPKENRNLVWIHLSSDERYLEAMDRNIKLLELQVDEQEAKDPRTLFYLGKTWYDKHTEEGDDKAEKLIWNYLEGPYPSGWQEERGNAWEYLGNLAARKGDHQEAINRYHNAIREYPNHHMPYLLLSREYEALGQFDQSKFWVEMVLRMDPPQTRTTIGNPLEIKALAASVKYNQAIRELKIDDAIHWLKTRDDLLAIKDNDMMKQLEDVKALNEAGKNVFLYAKWLKDTDQAEKVRKLLESLPPELGREPFAFHIANEINEPRTWQENEICYYASWGQDHFEGWSPKSLETGIGGSETAVMQLAKHWVTKGFKVTVYGDPREQAGEFDGVTYRPWYEVNWRDTFNILILWRAPHLLDREIKAKKLFMDLHDIASQLDWTNERMQRVDKVFFKSQWHRAQLPKLPDEKAVVIPNGI